MINNIKDGSGERLKTIRKELGLTQVQFASKLNISNGHLSDLEKDRKNITDSLIQILNFTYQVNSNWLTTGNGKIFDETDDLYKLFGYMINDMEEDEKKFMKNFLSLSQENRKQTIQFLKKLVSD